MSTATGSAASPGIGGRANIASAASPGTRASCTQYRRRAGDMQRRRERQSGQREAQRLERPVGQDATNSSTATATPRPIGQLARSAA